MLYCFLNSDNKEQKYRTLFEALTKCYTPLGESPLCSLTHCPYTQTCTSAEMRKLPLSSSKQHEKYENMRELRKVYHLISTPQP